MFKYRYPKKHPKIYLIITIVVAIVIVGWLLASGQLDNVIQKDKLLARWDIYKNTQVLKKNPNDYDALIRLGVDNYIIKDLDASLKAYERATQVSPTGYLAWNNVGNVRRDLMSFWDAEKAYLEAIRINPNYIPAYINLADLYTIWPQDQKGDQQKRKILPLLQKGIRANPSSEQLQETLKAYISANK